MLWPSAVKRVHQTVSRVSHPLTPERAYCLLFYCVCCFLFNPRLVDTKKNFQFAESSAVYQCYPGLICSASRGCQEKKPVEFICQEVLHLVSLLLCERFSLVICWDSGDALRACLWEISDHEKKHTHNGNMC